MKNPFEEKRKNDRINSLVKERDELSAIVKQQQSELDFERMNRGVVESSLINLTNLLTEARAKMASYESAIDGLKNVIDSLHKLKSL